MKIKTDIRAGMTFEECDAQRNYWKSQAQSGYCDAYVTYPPGYYPPGYYPPGYYPPPTGASTVPAGACPSQWASGLVEESSGGGYYGQIRGTDGLVHYFNAGYTQFYPSNQGVYTGQTVAYAPFPAGNERAGKAACISQSYPY
jgi:hypothetical protein